MRTDPPSHAASERHRVGILVLGMHRSGTSALARLLGAMGAALPSDAIPGGPENPLGYWESAGLVAADEQLNRAAGSSWFDLRPLDLARLPPALLEVRRAAIRDAIAQAWGGAPLLAIKDPRQCRFVPVVTAEVARLGIAPRAVLMLRGAGEVATSLLRRDATIASYGVLLWLRHMLDAERDTRALPRAVVSYDMLVRDPRTVVARLAPLVGWPADHEVAADAMPDARLRHHHDVALMLPAPLDALIADAERAFADLERADDDAARDALDAVRARWDAMPWLDGDVVHDELRHRRAPAPAPSPEAEPVAPPIAAPPLPPEPAADADGDAALIRGSGLFDPAWYLATYPDARASGLDPVTHYLQVGAALGHDPNPLFGTAYYARQMARRAALGGAA